MVRVLAVVAAAVSIVVIALLIAAVSTPKWLKYVSSTDTGTVKTDLIADIGLWTSCLDVTVTVTITIPFVGTTVTTTPSYSCVDSIDASIDPYFPNGKYYEVLKKVKLQIKQKMRNSAVQNYTEYKRNTKINGAANSNPR